MENRTQSESNIMNEIKRLKTKWTKRERAHAKEIASLRAQLEEACNFVVDSECSCLPGGSPGNEGTCERCVWLEERDDD